MTFRFWAIAVGCLSCILILPGCPMGGGGGGNVAPVAMDQSVDVMIDTPEDITLMATDADSGPQALTFSIVTQPTAGTLSAISGNQVTYTPNPQFAGLDRFTFIANDGADDSNEAEVCIEVTATPQDGSTNDCSTIGGGGGGAGGGGGGGGGSGADPRLTVTIEVSPRAQAVRVVGFENKGLVERADAESTVTRWDFTSVYANGSVAQHVQAYPRGTQISLVCDENMGGGTQSAPPQGAFIPAQFVEWAGDTQDTAMGADKGVLFFTMELDRTIIARFDDMDLLEVHVIGGADGAGTLLDYDYLAQAPLTIPPRHTANARNINVVGTILSGQSGAIRLSGFANDGTVMQLCIPAGQRFTSWSGDGVISGRCVTVTFGMGTNVTLTFP